MTATAATQADADAEAAKPVIMHVELLEQPLVYGALLYYVIITLLLLTCVKTRPTCITRNRHHLGHIDILSVD